MSLFFLPNKLEFHNGAFHNRAFHSYSATKGTSTYDTNRFASFFCLYTSVHLGSTRHAIWSNKHSCQDLSKEPWCCVLFQYYVSRRIHGSGSAGRILALHGQVKMSFSFLGPSNKVSVTLLLVPGCSENNNKRLWPSLLSRFGSGMYRVVGAQKRLNGETI